eukprot:2187268-Prymnesium_polylepis.1
MRARRRRASPRAAQASRRTAARRAPHPTRWPAHPLTLRWAAAAPCRACLLYTSPSPRDAHES